MEELPHAIERHYLLIVLHLRKLPGDTQRVALGLHLLWSSGFDLSRGG